MKDDNVNVKDYMAEVRRKHGLPAKRSKRAEVDVRPFSDDALALHFAELHAADLRYVDRWSTWMRYDDMRWQADDTLAVFDHARVGCRTAAAEAAQPKLAKELMSA